MFCLFALAPTYFINLIYSDLTNVALGTVKKNNYHDQLKCIGALPQ